MAVYGSAESKYLFFKLLFNKKLFSIMGRCKHFQDFLIKRGLTFNCSFLSSYNNLNTYSDKINDGLSGNCSIFTSQSVERISYPRLSVIHYLHFPMKNQQIKDLFHDAKRTLKFLNSSTQEIPQTQFLHHHLHLFLSSVYSPPHLMGLN